MSATSRSLTNAGLFTLVFIGSGIFLLAAQFLIARPAEQGALHELTGTVTDVVNTKHPREPAHTVSFDLTIAGQDGGETVLQIVKQAIAPKVVRDLVNKEIVATHDGILIYELRRDGATLFTYDDVAAMLVRDRAAVAWGGYPCLAIGLLLMAWAHFSGRRLIG